MSKGPARPRCSSRRSVRSVVAERVALPSRVGQTLASTTRRIERRRRAIRCRDNQSPSPSSHGQGLGRQPCALAKPTFTPPGPPLWTAALDYIHSLTVGVLAGADASIRRPFLACQKWPRRRRRHKRTEREVVPAPPVGSPHPTTVAPPVEIYFPSGAPFETTARPFGLKARVAVSCSDIPNHHLPSFTLTSLSSRLSGKVTLLFRSPSFTLLANFQYGSSPPCFPSLTKLT